MRLGHASLQLTYHIIAVGAVWKRRALIQAPKLYWRPLGGAVYSDRATSLYCIHTGGEIFSSRIP